MRHDFPGLLGNKGEEIHQIIGASGKEFPQFRILGSHANRTGIIVTLSHHDTAEYDQRGRREPVFLGAQQRGNHDIPTRLDLSVSLQTDLAPQIIQHQGLLGFSQPKFPGRTGVLDGG